MGDFSLPLVSADNVFAMGTVLIGLAYFGFWIDNHPIGKKTSGVVWVLVLAMALSNFRIIPFTSPAYDFVGGYMVSLAIPLLLFKADIRRIFRESGKVIITFFIASAATVAGAIIGFFLLDLGEIGPKVAGTYTGGYVGGAVNFLAVSQVVEMTESQFTSAISASSVVSILALMMLIAIPTVKTITKFIPTQFSDTIDDAEKEQLKDSSRSKVYLRHLTGALALSFGICAVAGAIGNAIGQSQYNILFVTILTIIIANAFPKAMDRLEGEFELGMIFMYVFFAMVGSSTNATAFLGSAMVLFFYGMTIIILHLVIVLGAAKLLKIDLAEAIVASGAALVGPAVTAAIAISQGWRTLVTPAIMCGIFGYVIGTFIGVAVTQFLM
ncbi:MAG: DUF819 family protein [Gammaproteobacteria bacterium]|nr:DUF819 family protein [Gammaproteobacteria bacterium]